MSDDRPQTVKITIEMENGEMWMAMAREATVHIEKPLPHSFWTSDFLKTEEGDWSWDMRIYGLGPFARFFGKDELNYITNKEILAIVEERLREEAGCE